MFEAIAELIDMATEFGETGTVNGRPVAKEAKSWARIRQQHAAKQQMQQSQQGTAEDFKKFLRL